MTPVAISSSALVLFNHTLSEALANTADLEGWATLATRNRGDALRTAITLRPRSVLMQISNRSELPVSVRLVEALRKRFEHMPVYAWSVEHDTVIEKTVRGAGVHAYIAGKSGLIQLLELLSRHQQSAVSAHAHSPPSRARPPNSTEHDTIETNRY